jgi:hypothetical protein
MARRFWCDAVLCGRRIFYEQFNGSVLARYGRRTQRLETIVHHLGLALGGRPAAAFANRLMMPVSNDTLFLPPQETFILKTFGIGQKFGVDHGIADRFSDLTHGFADSVEKGAARVLHQMPSICYLVGMRQRFGDCLAIPTASIAGDNRDRRMFCEPGPRGVLFPIWKQCHGPAPLKVADNCPVSLAASKCEVVDTDDGEFVTRLLSPPAHDTQQGVVAHRHR